jgi:CRP/FNR family transcriptional regulator, cyclic AMP receptor protein
MTATAGAAFPLSIRVGQSTVKYTRGETIFRQGDLADAIFYIQTGSVQITVVSEQGKEGIIAMLGAGEFFGERCIAGPCLQRGTAGAMADSVVVRIEKETMLRNLRADPALAQSFIAFLLSRNVQLETDLLDQLFNSSEKRLARTLLLLADKNAAGQTAPAIPRISQEALAARVGTTRSRINYFMNKFRRLGFIEYDRELKVHASLLTVIGSD